MKNVTFDIKLLTEIIIAYYGHMIDKNMKYYNK